MRWEIDGNLTKNCRQCAEKQYKITRANNETTTCTWFSCRNVDDQYTTLKTTKLSEDKQTGHHDRADTTRLT